jgi:hypothetical protein
MTRDSEQEEQKPRQLGLMDKIRGLETLAQTTLDDVRWGHRENAVAELQVMLRILGNVRRELLEEEGRKLTAMAHAGEIAGSLDLTLHTATSAANSGGRARRLPGPRPIEAAITAAEKCVSCGTRDPKRSE